MAFRSASTPQTFITVGSSAFTMPAGVQPTDILLLVITGTMNGLTTFNFTSGTGWSTLMHSSFGSSNGGIGIGWALGTATAPTITWGGSSNDLVGQIIAFSGRNSVTPTYTEIGVDTAGNSFSNSAPITATANDDIFIVMGGYASSVTSSAPVGTTLITSTVVASSTPVVATHVYINNVSAGTVPAYTFTTDPWIERFSVTIALKFLQTSDFLNLNNVNLSNLNIVTH